MEIQPVYVDDRYRGAHGIGRYSSEVLPRLGVPNRLLGLTSSPSSPLGIFSRLPSEAQGALVYSPGYGVLASARTQLITVHDLIHLSAASPHPHAYRTYYDLLIKAKIRRCGAVLTVSETSANAIRNWISDPSVEVVNAGIGCAQEFIDAEPGGGGDEAYLLYVGNLRPHKNLFTVLHAIKQVTVARLKVIVPSSESAQLLKAVTELGISDRVSLVNAPSDKELALLYSGAAATAMPSLIEGFGLPALESVMAGTPVLYWSGCEAVRETVGDRGCAVGDAKSVDEWADAIKAAVTAPTRVQPPDSGKYSWGRTAERVTEVIAGLGGER